MERQFLWTVGLSSAMMLGTIATSGSAHALQFKKLVEIGQKLPGNDQTVEQIIAPAIGTDGRVVFLGVNRQIQKEVGAPEPDTFQFSGTYQIEPNGAVRLVEGGTTKLGYGGYNITAFSTPDISQSKISYLLQRDSGARETPRKPTTQVKFGPLGAVKVLFESKLVPEIRLANANVSLVNGKTYYFERDSSNTNAAPVITLFSVKNNGQPQPLLRSDDGTVFVSGAGLPWSSPTVRATSSLVLVPRVSFSSSPDGSDTNYYESLDNGQFRQILTSRGGFCGASASFENLAICDKAAFRGGGNYRLVVRFGKNGQFQNISYPIRSATRRLSGPSIYKQDVIFKVFEGLDNSDTIYLSRNAQAATKLVTTGDRIDNKTVATLELSDTGRAIAKNSIVFTATFTDGTTALYKATF